MNNYLLECTDSLSLQKERENLIKENNFKDATISFYDLEENTLDQVLEDLDTYGFLSNKKVVIIQNIENTKYDEFKEDYEHLFKYLENSNPDNLLIIEAKKLNNTSKVTKNLKKLCNYKQIILDATSYIKEALKGYKIDSSTISLLKEYCLDDITKISQECEKLKNYKIETKEITKEDIKELVTKKLGDSKDLVFAFSKSLANKDKKDALKKYRELISYNIEPFGIIGLLASQIRIIYQVKLLEKKRMNNKEIANTLEEKEFRIKKTKELTNLYSEEELLLLMQELSKIDLQLKTSDIDANHLIEMFILNI